MSAGRTSWGCSAATLATGTPRSQSPTASIGCGSPISDPVDGRPAPGRICPRSRRSNIPTPDSATKPDIISHFTNFLYNVTQRGPAQEIGHGPAWRKGSVFTIELTRGLSWSEPIETIDRRKCDTISIEFVAAEALHWLLTTQKNVPTWGVTHYRVVNHGEAVIGGDTLTAANVRGAHVRWLEATRSKERTR